MNRRRTLSLVALLVFFAVLAAACGQKAGVHSTGLAAGGGGGLADGSTTATSIDANGNIVAIDPATGQVIPSGGGGTSGGTSGGSGGGASAGTGGRSGSGGSTGPSGPADRTGVTDSVIKIGIHAPASGAGAPAPSFDMGKAVYFTFIGSSINGRRVEVVFKDDGYNPSQAVQACKSMVQNDHVFLLVGGAGTDQIVACAKYAASVGVPYLSEGVTENGLGNLPGVFAETMTYKAQGALLAQYIKKQGFTKVAMVRGNTGNFDDAHSGFLSGAQAQGLTMVKDLAINKDSGAAEVSNAASQVCGARAGEATDKHDVAVYPLMSPKLFINFAGAAAQQFQCFPRYAGIGITLGINIVAQGVCQVGGFKTGGTFFSPFQGIASANQVDPDYQKAYQAQNGQAGDDIGFSLWAAEKVIAAQLKGAGRDLSRQSFVASLKGKSFTTGVYPTVNFANGPFGGTATHVLKVDCSKGSGGEFQTESQNNKSF
ncbi:MAG: branched-chain amino acid transport system substrate-binding protein [Actinomycetota bacterium]|jgi:ABC-type branched-subunit amino acid transport system substrate-binding protein|nr:branched-chain amino acid transport system substrate-binding protein [Actinomycetota bacterium]